METLGQCAKKEERAMGARVLAGDKDAVDGAPGCEPQAMRVQAQHPMQGLGVAMAKSKGYVLSMLNLTAEKGDDGGVSELVQAIQKRKRQVRGKIFDEQLPFSWARFCFGLFSLMLVCSDVPRSGLGINRFPTVFRVLEPDVFEAFGPWHYPIVKLSADNATDESVRVWSYKYDTTSIGLRAFAEFYQLSAFPDCIMYRTPCENLTFSGKPRSRCWTQLWTVLPRRRDRSICRAKNHPNQFT